MRAESRSRRSRFRGCLHKKHVTSVIIGAKNEQQLNDNLAATSG